MWRKLTKTRDLGDTWTVDWKEQLVVDLIISGQPCTDYSSSGGQRGTVGDTGYMYVQQAELLLKI
jgi:site-specific DNA-cytosine methylase